MTAMADLIATLTLEGDDGRYVATPRSDAGFLPAGTLAALSVAATAKALPESQIRSAHSLFLQAASPSASIDVSVDVLHAGRQLSAATVRLHQSGRLCVSSQVMLGPLVDGLIDHAAPRPDVPLPEGLPLASAEGPAEVRVVGGVDPYDLEAAPAPSWDVWSRATGLPATAGLPEAFLAYQANAFVVSAAVLPHAGVSMSSAHQDLMAVINSSHVVFHRRVPAQEWVLFSQESTFAGAGWVFGRGQAFAADGTLLASYAEEAMLRALPSGRARGM
jgi:acyl-CoA thioesterase II